MTAAPGLSELPATTGQAIWFAHWLRGLSIVLVVAAHLGVNFWAGNEESAELVHVDPLPNALLERVSGLVADHGAFNSVWPSLAVGFFFLISGFLIPLTLEGRSPKQFLVRRFWRIYPAWLAGLLLIGVLFAIRSATSGEPVGVSAGAWIANAFTVPDLAHVPTLNPPGWTLLIEIKFYLLSALAAKTVGLDRAWPIGTFAALLALYAVIAWQNFVPLAVASHPAWVVSQTIAWDVSHLCVILIGVCFYNRMRHGWSVIKTVACAAVCFMSMSVATWFVDDGAPHRLAKYVAYVITVAVFALAYGYRDRFPSNRVILYLAEFSFSLYVVHFVLGMVLCDTFVRLTGRPLVSTLAAALVVVSTAALVHRWIEAPGIRYGKRATVHQLRT